IAPNVVLTAAHCFTQVATRCAPYEYAQPLAPDAGAFKVTIPPIDPNSPPGQPKFLTDYDDTNSRKIDVLAIQPHPARIRNLVEDCCNGDVTTCSDVCTLKSGLKLGHRLHDLALAYLAEPVTDIAPMDVLLEVAASSETAVPSIGRYHVDWSALAGTLLGVAGTSASDGDTTGRDRVYGTVSLSSAAYPYPSDAPNQVSLTQFGCDPDTAVNVEYSCPECTVGTVADPSCTVPGDSGGPVFLNATNIGGDPIPGFTSSVVAGALKSGAGSSTCGSAWMRHTGTWDAMYTLGGFSVPTENGSWIRARRQDFDNDGVPNETDNCPVAPNPKQENCNVDAEDAKGYPRRGDACDPIPCAASDVAPPVEVVTASSNNGFVTTIQGRRYQDTFAVLPRASQEFGNGSNMGDAQDSLSVPGVGTHYSFCQRDPVHQVHCGSESIDNGFLDPAEGLPDPSRPYHLARVGPTGATSAGFTNEPVDYPQAPMDRTWHYLDDSALWEQEHWIDPVSGAVVGSGWGTNLDGRFWFHSDTSVGTAAAGSSTGYRVRPDGTTSPDDQHLSNHYFPMKPDGAFVRAHVGVLLDWPELWFPLCDPLREIWDGFGEERGPIVPLGEGLHGLPLRNGEMVDLGEHLGPALRERLDDPGVTWATAVEPMAWQ
ncbi:MAG: thrombospondin type 3 repeat-containing protein, partial [Myxococcales bacterium]|nr:thrombospondin type 3 repeat-containing protein [Myxococcales bacterium]